MKIYICGSHAVGKSTLARYIAKTYNLNLVTEVARMVLSERETNLADLRHNLDEVDSYQLQVFRRQLEEEQKYLDFVSDRSCLDSAAYAAQHSRILPKIMKDAAWRPYIESLKSQDSIVFFVRPSKATLKADGVRETINWDGIVAIDAQVKFLLEMEEVPYFQISVDNMQERTRLIDNTLKLYKK